MRHTVTMPALSDTMNVGRLVRWLKKPGDGVRKGEAIAEVETDKALMDVEAFNDGYLAGPLAPLDTDVTLGAPIAYIVDTQEEAAEVTAPAPAQVVQPVPPTSASIRPPAPRREIRASPYARSLAHILGVDLAKIPAGRSAPIGAAQLLHAVGTLPPPDLTEGPSYRLERASSLREAVARQMIASVTTPVFRVGARLPLDVLQTHARQSGNSLTLLLARACALAIRAHPLFNAAYTPEGLAHRERIDIGIAAEIPEGLITPVLRDVAQRPLAELARDWYALREKLKTRRLTAQDYRGATFYLSDLGVFPVVETFDSVVPPGACAILSVAAARNDGAMCTLTCDHRVVFGADAARLLTTLGEYLHDPGKLGG
jgi:pyruvate dehydrogenase E2 component (dihydrolipoamide acetyltransferase)